MLAFALRRLLLLLPTLLGLLVLTFVLVRALPSDPAAALAGENATPAQIQAIREQYGFDQPLYVQFGVYMGQVLQGDLGVSVYSNRPVALDLIQRLPATLELTFAALLLAAVVGIPLGVLAAVDHNGLLDHAIRLFTVGGLALASFWLAIMFQLLFAMEWNVLPLRGRLGIATDPPPGVTGLYLVDSVLAGQWRTLRDALAHLVLPATTLALAALATLTRFTRSAMLDVLQRDFIAYERAVGYPRRRIVVPFALRNALVTPVTQVGLLFGALISGAVAVEAIFDWPGVGSYAVAAILNADFKAVLGVTLLVGVIYAVVNLVVDILHALIDPRVAEQL